MNGFVYEKVEDMTVGDVAQAMSEGVKFYRHYKEVIIDSTRLGIHSGNNVTTMDLDSLRMELNGGYIYTRREKAWWEEFKGHLIMVKNSGDMWEMGVLDTVDLSREYPFRLKFTPFAQWKYARPLTVEERDTIMVEG